MATSSIFTGVKINTQREAESFIAALEASEQSSRLSNTTRNMRFVTDHDEIRRMLAKREAYK